MKPRELVRDDAPQTTIFDLEDVMGKFDDMDRLWAAAEISRRALLASGALTGFVAGFAAATQPVMAQTMIVTEPSGLDAGMVEIPVGSEKVAAYRAAPKDGKSLPIILVVQEVFGVHEHIKDVCRRFAKLGYCAIAPELYQRQGDVSGMSSIDDIRKVVGAVPDKQVLGDLDAPVAWAKATGVGDDARLGITGFCWGGRIVWLYAAHNPKVKAGVAWYGRIVGDKTEKTPENPIDTARKISGSVLGLYGGADAGIPVATVDEMKKALGEGSKSQLHVYPDAPHAFFADYRPSYRKEAAEDGWKRATAWFKANGVT
jgi:carboxymethylenebutenolidase